MSVHEIEKISIIAEIIICENLGLIKVNDVRSLS